MFKQLQDGWNAPKITKAMNATHAAIMADRIDIAQVWIQEAYKLLLKTTMPRAVHIDMIFAWSMNSITLEKKGYTELAGLCAQMEKLLQARLDAGEFYG